MHRKQKASVLAISAAAAALMILPRLEGAQKKQPAIKTGDHIDLPVDAQEHGGDFDQTIVGRAPLQSEAAADSCFTQAVSFLASQRAALQKNCSEGDGIFNTGTLTAGLHRDTCTVSQMVTCTGTTATRDQEARKRAAAEAQKRDLQDKAHRVGAKATKTTAEAGALPSASEASDPR